MIKSFLINYFGFNRQQRNGLFLLLAGIFVLLIARLSLSYFITPDKIEIKNLNLATINDDNIRQQNKQTNSENSKSETLFSFDPNTVTEQKLHQLGFSDKQAASFIRYRSKGFVFKKKEDLKKVFVVSDNLYNKLAPYVQIKHVQS